MYLNRLQRDFWGVSEEGVATFSWASTLLPEDAEQVFGPFGDAMAQQKPFVCEGRYRRADGAVRILQTCAEPRFEDGVFTGMVGVNRDVTEERRAQAELAESEQRRALLMSEMSHRMKNMLTTVISIAAQTGRTAPSIAAFNASLQARLVALAKSNDLLMRDATDSAELRDILEAELRPYAGDGRTLVIDGAPVRLRGRAALGLALIVHELATNAAKYGAYAGAGTLAVTWTISRDAPHAPVTLLWREASTQAVQPPARKGFGSRLIEAVLASDLGGVMHADFSSGALVAELRFSSDPTALN